MLSLTLLLILVLALLQPLLVFRFLFPVVTHFLSVCSVDVANNFALVGLDQLERTFPILQQSTDEVSSCRCSVRLLSAV